MQLREDGTLGTSSEEEEDEDDVPVRRGGFRMIQQSVGGGNVQTRGKQVYCITSFLRIFS